MHTILVLGVGCRRCEALFASAQRAARSCGIDCEVRKVTDVVQMLDFKVIALPALVIDGKVVSAGSVPSPEEIARLIPVT